VPFFVLPTICFQILYVFLVLAHDRRRILHFGVTAHPTAEWTGQQLREAFPWDSAPRFLLRDRTAARCPLRVLCGDNRASSHAETHSAAADRHLLLNDQICNGRATARARSINSESGSSLPRRLWTAVASM
jgi:hypothetical protein